MELRAEHAAKDLSNPYRRLKILGNKVQAELSKVVKVRKNKRKSYDRSSGIGKSEG